MLDPVTFPQLERVHAKLGGQVVHQVLDGVGRLRPAGAPVGVGGGLAGEHAGTAEPVGVHLVDRVEHERPEQRHARSDEHQVGAHVGEQVDVEPADAAVGVGGEPQPLDLVAAVMDGHVALGPGLRPLHRAAELAREQQREHLFRGDLQLRAEAAAHVRRDDPQLVLGYAGDEGEHDPQHVRDLGGRPHRVLVGDGRADHGPRFHGRRDQPLLTVGALDHHRRVTERGVYVPVAERPGERLVPGRVQLHGAVRESRLHVEHRLKRLVVHVDELERVGGGVAVAGDHARHDLAAVPDGVHRHRRVLGDNDVRGDGPGAGQRALLRGEVGAGVGGEDPGGLAGRGHVDGGDPRVRVRAAQERDMHHAGERDVVGPVGLPGDQAGVFLPCPGLADLGRGEIGRGHAVTSVVAVPFAARRTARTMFW